MKTDILRKVPGPLAVALSGVLLAGNAAAATVTFGDGGSALQGVLDSITVGGPSSVDVVNDAVADAGDTEWLITASGGSVATLIVEIASFANTNVFGVYDVFDPTNMVTIFQGADSAGNPLTTGSQRTLSLLADGTVIVSGADGYSATGSFGGTTFGYFLDSSAEVGGGLFYSDTSLNSDMADHMYAYQGTGDTVQIDPFAAGPWTPNEYILAWEDLDFSNTDADFTDMVLMVESVQPVPLPPAVLLFGSALIGVTAIARRRKQAAVA